jgi:hypothetical protein
MASACYGPAYGDEMPRSVMRFHAMDYLLRPGETLSRYAAPSGGRWHFPPHWIEDSKKYSKEWKDKGQQERFPPHRTYFNGCFEYRPDLTSASRDLTLGAWSLDNIGASEAGMSALDAKRPGRAIFLIQSPWIITGVPQDFQDSAKKTGAVTAEINVSMGSSGGSAALLVSLDGMTWQEIARVTQGGRLLADLSDEFDRRYRGLIAVDVSGSAVVTSFALQVWFQHAANSFPYLSKGETVFRYHGLDDHGRRTISEPWLAEIEESEASFRQAVVSSSNLTRGPGPLNRLSPGDPAQPWQAVFRVAPRMLAPRPIVRTWVWASVASVKGDPDAPCADYLAKRPKARLEAASSLDGPWTVVNEAKVPVHKQGYHFSLDGEYLPHGDEKNEGVPEIYIRVTSDMPCWEVRAAFACAMPVPPTGTPRLEIIHQWKEDGQPREHRQAVRDSSSAFEYRVMTGGEKIEDAALIFRVPSTRKT